MPTFLYIPAASSSAWTPSDLTDLWGWWKADAITNKSDGDSVGTWSDSSGNSRDMTLASGGTSVYKTSIQNGKPIVRLTNKEYSTGSVIDDCPSITMAAVLEKDVAAGTTGYVSGSDGTTTNRSFIYGTISGDTLLFITYGSSTYDYRPSHTWNDGAFKVICTRSNHSSGTFVATVNGTETNNVTGLGTGNLVSTPTTTYIGAGAGVGNHYGDYAEVILIKGAVTNDEMDKLEGYLAHKWGLEGNLPSGHPYKSAAP